MEKKNLKLRDLNEDQDLELKELMEVHGGEDEDEDCYVFECAIRASITCQFQTCWTSTGL